MISTTEWDTIAILRTAGFQIERTEYDEGSSRVRFVFSGEQAEADKVLQAHELGKLRLPTLALLDAFRWAKIQTHKLRDSTGINGNREKTGEIKTYGHSR